MKCGLLYLSHESCLVGDVSYHNYEGLPDDPAGREKLARDLGVHNKVRRSRTRPASAPNSALNCETFFRSCS
jgi:hypothetical protein